MALNFTTTADMVIVVDAAPLRITGALSAYAWVKTAAGGPHAVCGKAENTGVNPNLNPYDLSIVASGGSAPTLPAQGATIANTTGTLTVVLPSHQADDILILCTDISAPNSAAFPIADIPTPTGWTLATTQVGYDPLAGTDYQDKYACFWKRATSSSETNPAISRGSGWDTGADTCFGGRAYTVRGCITTGTPWDAINTSGPHLLANQNFPTVTVSGAGRMVIIFGEGLDDTAFSMASSGWTTGTEDNDPTGTDCVFQTARKENVSSSTSADASTVSIPINGPYVFYGISFKPVPGSDNFVFRRSNASATDVKTSVFTLTSGTWAHLAVTDTNDGTANNCKLYKDGTAENFTATSLTLSDSGKSFLIGERETAIGGNCAIGWVGLHNVVLTAEEIADAMQHGFTLRGLMGAWPLFGNDGESDISGNIFNGILIDATEVAGPPVLPPWYVTASPYANIAALKNENPGYPGQVFMIGGKIYHQFLKTPILTGVNARDGFSLNDLAP